MNNFVELQAKYPLGTRMFKAKGSAWAGRVVGYYKSSLTDEGLAIESDTSPGAVQIYPAAAMSPVPAPGEVSKPTVAAVEQDSRSGRWFFSLGSPSCLYSADELAAAPLPGEAKEPPFKPGDFVQFIGVPGVHVVADCRLAGAAWELRLIGSTLAYKSKDFVRVAPRFKVDQLVRVMVPPPHKTAPTTVRGVVIEGGCFVYFLQGAAGPFRDGDLEAIFPDEAKEQADLAAQHAGPIPIASRQPREIEAATQVIVPARVISISPCRDNGRRSSLILRGNNQAWRAEASVAYLRPVGHDLRATADVEFGAFLVSLGYVNPRRLSDPGPELTAELFPEGS